MYTAVELKEAKIKPKINDITLDVLREYYEYFLYSSIYTYRITSQNHQWEIELRFDIENFCHLLGVETVVRQAVKVSELYNYRGKKGWDNIKSGLVDIKHLKELNKRQFNSVKAKYVYFYLIPVLLDSPLGVNYDRSKVVTSTKIECEILFYNEYNNAVIHLGLEKKTDEKYYIPRTFFVEKLGKNGSVDRYVENQEKITVMKKERIIMM